jgi:hypothetical protein
LRWAIRPPPDLTAGPFRLPKPLWGSRAEAKRLLLRPQTPSTQYKPTSVSLMLRPICGRKFSQKASCRPGRVGSIRHVSVSLSGLVSTGATAPSGADPTTFVQLLGTNARLNPIRSSTLFVAAGRSPNRAGKTGRGRCCTV